MCQALPPSTELKALRLRPLASTPESGFCPERVSGTIQSCIKLIAAAVRTPAGIQASVLPSAVERESPLGQTDGVLNRIEVDGWPIGSVAFAGPGAVGAATSSAVLADLVALSRQGGSTWAGLGTASGPTAALAPLDGDVFVGPSGSAYPVIR